MRIGIGGLHHETNSFSNIPVTWQLMDSLSDIGEEMRRKHTGVHKYIGGFLQKGVDLGIETVPSSMAYLTPSGHMTQEALEKHRDRIVDMLWQAHQEKPLDAIALNLHGAGVADGYDDADGEILRAVREKFGPDMPIGVPLDLHANVTDQMMQYADLLIGVKCYPHTDEYECAMQVFEILADMTANNWRPFQRKIRLPWLIVPAEGVTLSGPAYEVQRKCLQTIEADEDLIDVTFFQGFPYSDIAEAGVTVTAMGKTQEAADRAALEVARFAWERRHAFAVPANSAEKAFDLALAVPAGNGPVVINESSDNTGGGAPGDGTHLLREMLKRNIPNSAYGYIYDPEVVQLAAKAGVGSTISCSLGGKMDRLHGEPIQLTNAYVRSISDGKAINYATMHYGMVRNIGLTACLVVGNVSIVVGSIRTQPMDDAAFRVAGLRYDLLQIAALKSSQHFKGWWAERSRGIVPCDSPGIHCADLTVFDFKNTNTAFFPLEDPEWSEDE